ncbi:MAG: c-type cytochrome, partial [Planctomycetota bacterium]|nr:c-type cytochrome [Planctomycetota bacterium]
MRSHTLSLLAVLILSPLVGVAIGWGAWWYAEMMTRERINSSASMHDIKAPGTSNGFQTRAPATSARALFSAYCAQCHGETGDGKGTQVLDRPARSFRDGGFSFGNTRDAIFRTISSGIGGTPMPGFSDSLSIEERRALAAHVQTLGPPVLDVSIEDMVLEVRDTPLVVRGHLPSLGDGLPEHPRGLLIGGIDGLTTEYRVDDVRLLAVRQGRFVERTDWSGRGGTPLKPLGPVIHLIDGGDPAPTFELDQPLEARLLQTTIKDGRASVIYVLDYKGIRVLVEEWIEAFTHPAGPGYIRNFHILYLDEDRMPTLRLPGSGHRILERIEGPARSWIVREGADGRIEIHGFDSNSARVIEGEGDILRLQLPSGTEATLSLVTLL